MEKNMDTLFKNVKATLYKSTNAIIPKLFPDGSNVNEATKRTTSTGSAFRTSLNDLVKNLLKKNPNYGKFELERYSLTHFT